LTYIFAHRGSSKDCPENTMAAFQKAFKDGADGIELDVQLSKDGVPVIIHDEKVDRTTNGKGYVVDYTFDELSQLDAGSWFSKNKESVPSLQQFLEWITPLPMLLNIELKNNIVEYNGLEENVLQLLQHYGMMDRTVISSFNHYSLVKIRRLNKYVQTAPLYSSGLFEPWEYVKAVCSQSAHPNYKSLQPYIMKGFKRNNIPVRPYTVNSQKWMKYFFEWNTEAIITDYPILARDVLNSLSPHSKSRFLQK
jgi:glycerophosphoryl diester phosphodiesterase